MVTTGVWLAEQSRHLLVRLGLRSWGKQAALRRFWGKGKAGKGIWGALGMTKSLSRFPGDVGVLAFLETGGLKGQRPFPFFLFFFKDVLRVLIFVKPHLQ